MLYLAAVLRSQLFLALHLFVAEWAPLCKSTRGKTSCQPTEAIIGKFALIRKLRLAQNMIGVALLAVFAHTSAIRGFSSPVPFWGRELKL